MIRHSFCCFLAANMLFGCSGLNSDTANFIAEAQSQAQNVCQFVPAVSTVVDIAALLSPSSAGAGIFSAVETAKKICAKVDEYKATKRIVRLRGTFLTVGQIEGVPVTGFFVAASPSN